MLLRRMQLYVSCKSSEYRAYLYNFYGEIFNDPSVVVDEASYQRFVDFMEVEVDYCAKKNLHLVESVYRDENFQSHYVFLQNAFAAIGVNMELATDEQGDPTSLTFTLPSGEQKVLDDFSTKYMNGMVLYVRSQMRVTDDYLQKMKPYYLLENEEPLDLTDIGTNAAGYNTRWEYDADTATLKITGNGTLADSELWGLLGIDTISTIIIGAGVYSLLANSLDFSNVTIVDLHGETDEIMLEFDKQSDDFGGSATIHFYGDPKNAKSWIFYTDNLTLRNVAYDENVSIEWHSLSEWEG